MKAPRVSRLMLASGLLAALVGCGSSPASPEPSPEPGPTTVEEIPPPPPAVAPGPAPERPSKVCVACGKALVGRVIELDGRRYHPDCYELFGPHCGICQRTIHGRYVTLGDGLDYHKECLDATPRCDGCGLPAGGKRGPALRWKDGRITCTPCKSEAVVDNVAARSALADARAALKTALGLDLGSIEVPIQLVSKDDLLAQAKEVGQPAIRALTIVREEGPGDDGKRGARSYRILALYGLPRAGLVGILAHELFHVAQSEASSSDRDAAFREGSANYVQVVILRARGEEMRARLIERDTDPVYGEGLRRFERLAQAAGQKKALQLGLRSIAFPDGY